MAIIFSPQAQTAFVAAQKKAEEDRKAAEEARKAEALKASATPVRDALNTFHMSSNPLKLRLVSKAGTNSYLVLNVDRDMNATVVGADKFKFKVRYRGQVEAQYKPQWG